MQGILLALQFFTVVPVTKSYPLTKRTITVMYMTLPLVGAAIGSIMYAIFTGLAYSDVSPFMTAVLVLLIYIVLTGGLHIDGFADTGDAFFSYRSIEKRHEILADPRLGAFGTLAIVCLLLVKVAIFYEITLHASGSILFFCSMPLFARATMNIYFCSTIPAKKEGIAAFYEQRLMKKLVTIWSSLLIILLLIVWGIVTSKWLVMLGMSVMIGCSIWFFHRWTIKHFGGVTGDLCGAFIEGGEALLWIIVILFI